MMRTPTFKYTIFVLLLMFFSLAKATTAATAESISQNLAQANVGICLYLNDGSKINSFEHIKEKANILESCPSLKSLNETVNELAKHASAQPDSEISSATDSAFIKKCMKKINPEYSTWIDVIKATTNFNLFKKQEDSAVAPGVVFLEEWRKGQTSQNYLFNVSYKNIYTKLNELSTPIMGDDGLFPTLSQKCMEATSLEQAIAVNASYNQDCGILKPTQPTQPTQPKDNQITISGQKIPLCPTEPPNNNCLDSIDEAEYSPAPFNEKKELLRSDIYKTIQGRHQEEANEVKKCIAAIALTKLRYSDGNNDDLGLLKTKPNVSTFNNTITCIDSGGEALDYNRCASFVDQFNITELLRLGEQTASEVITKNAQLEAQMNTDPNDPAFILRQQLKVLEGEKDAATVAAWVLSVRAALLAGFAGIAWPSSDDLIMKCTESLDTVFPATGSDFCGKEKCILPYLKTDPNLTTNYSLAQKNEYACVEAMGSMLLFPNANAHNLAKGMAVQAAAEAASKGVQAHFAGKNMDMLQDAIDNVDKATEAVDTPDFFTDLKVGPCATNPESEECRSAGFNTGLDMVNPTINTGTTVRGTTTGELAQGEDVNTNTAVTGDDKPADLAETVAGSDFKKKIGNEFARGPAAAKIASGGKLAGGGGGGGGGGGASTGPAQGGGGGGGGASTSSAVGNINKLRFNDNDSSKLSFSGGQGGSPSSGSRKSAANPLAALMGKNNGGTKTQEYARGTASIGSKGGNIFDQISTRYSDVNGKKRLIEYVEK